jgi:DeoR family transcriptional regulator of aga operon
MQLTRYIKDISKITVITNALNIASELSNSEINIILTGGDLDKESLTLMGPLAEETLHNIAADKLFQGIDGIDFDAGLTTPKLLEARTSRIMMKMSGENILLADSSKFGRRSLGVVNKIETVDKIITDEDITREDLRRLEDMSIEVIVV